MASVRDTVLGEHMIRKKKSEKTKFIDFARGRASELGYPSAVEEGSLGARNIVIGNPEAAEVVFTAHYDTPAAMPIPNFITPKNIFIYVCYQMLLVFLLVTPAVILGILVGTVLGLFGLGLGVTTFIAEAVYLVALFGFMLLLVAGPANKNTANDNSSGVITLLEIMERFPESERGRVAFIFFDLEEAGLIGSSSYKKAHSKFADRLPLINLDCVGDGRHVLLAVGKRAGELVPRLREAFVSEGDYTVEVDETLPEGVTCIRMG